MTGGRPADPPGGDHPGDRPGAASDDQEAFARLVRWVEEGGGEVGPLALGRDATGGRGVVARAPIAVEARLLAVPRALLMTREVARASEIGWRIEASGAPLASRHTWIAAYLLGERQARASRWRPYLDLLPSSYRHLPILFDDGELALLRGSLALEMIHERRRGLEDEYERLVHHVPSCCAFGYDAFVWARLSVLTRVFAMVIDGRKTEGMVPVADLLNHRAPRETAWGYEDDAGSFSLTALRALAPGEPVYDSYGTKSNSRFFANYGFALADNDDNRARILLPEGETTRSFEISAIYAAPEAQEVFARLRAAGAGDARGAAAIEETALAALAAACAEALSGFDTTIEEDDALLSDGGLSSVARSCVLVRREEKRVLRAYVELARAATPLLTAPRAEARRRVAESRAAGGLLGGWARGVLPLLAR